MKESKNADTSGREPRNLIPVFAITELANTLLYLLAAVLPFYSVAAGTRLVPGSAAVSRPFADGALGSALLAGADFAVSFGRLLTLTLLAVLVVLIPMGWRGLSRQERAMWTAAVLAGILVYSVTWPQSYAIQTWVLA